MAPDTGSRTAAHLKNCLIQLRHLLIPGRVKLPSATQYCCKSNSLLEPNFAIRFRPWTITNGLRAHLRTVA